MYASLTVRHGLSGTVPETRRPGVILASLFIFPILFRLLVLENGTCLDLVSNFPDEQMTMGLRMQL